MKAGRWIRIGILAALIAGLLFFIVRYGRDFLQAMLPLGIGILIAYILLPVVEAMERIKIPRKVSIILSFGLGFFIIMVIMLWLIPILVENIKDLTGTIPDIFETGLRELRFFIERNVPPHWQPDIMMEIDNKFIAAQEWLTQGIYNFFLTLPKTLSIIFDIMVAWILSFYILKDKERIVKSIRYFFPKSCRDDMLCVMRDLHRVVLRFIQGQVLIAVIIAILEMVGLYLIGIPYAPLIGFIGGISNIVPYFGPYIGAIPGMAVALTISPWKALWTALVFLAVQQLDNIYLSPRIMKGKLGLHPVTTIMAVIAGGRLFGFAGLIFSVPFTAMVLTLIKRVYRKVSG